jgi:phospholipid transport system substrate-binding protein
VLALALASQASASPALEVVRETLAEARRVVDDGGTRDQQLVSLRRAARGMLDTRAMGRRAIGSELAKQPADRQQEYFELFDHVIVRAYLSKLLLFRNPRFAYGEPRRRDGGELVRTRIVTSGDEYFVDYQMMERDGRWLATDVIVEGISLSDNYHEQFASLLRGRSFDELLELMRRKTRRLRAASE